MWSNVELDLPWLCAIRVVTVPLCLLSALVASSAYLDAAAIGALIAIDLLTTQLITTVKPVPAFIRDLIYALGFFACYATNPNVPALILYPVPLAEVCVLFKAKIAKFALLADVCLMAARVVALAAAGHFLIHPAWLIFMSLLLITSFGIGLLIHGKFPNESPFTKPSNTVRLVPKYPDSPLRSVTYLKRYIAWKRHGEGTLARADFDEGHPDTFSQTICDLENIGYIERSCLLTNRELQVLVLMSQELSYSEIARRLQISVGTARAHGAAILPKTSSHSRKDAVEKARSIGLLGP